AFVMNSLWAAENRVLQLDGKDAYVELPSQAFEGLEEMTIEAWVRSEDPDRSTTVLSFGKPFQSIQLSETAGDEFALGLASSDSPSVSVNPVLRAGRWMHVAVVAGALGIKFYLDGMLIGTTESRVPIADFFSKSVTEADLRARTQNIKPELREII